MLCASLHARMRAGSVAYLQCWTRHSASDIARSPLRYSTRTSQASREPARCLRLSCDLLLAQCAHDGGSGALSPREGTTRSRISRSHPHACLDRKSNPKARCRTTHPEAPHPPQLMGLLFRSPPEPPHRARHTQGHGLLGQVDAASHPRLNRNWYAPKATDGAPPNRTDIEWRLVRRGLELIAMTAFKGVAPPTSVVGIV